MTTLIDARLLLTIFLATLPLLGVILWNLLEIRSLRIACEHHRLFILDEPVHPVVVKP